jgi:hypothetical protein
MQGASARPNALKRLWRITEGGCLVTSVLIVILTIALMVTQKCNSTGFYKGNYEGQVIDKGIVSHESLTGSSVERYLVLEGKNGEQFSVYVTRAIYEGAQIGMWIRKTKTSQELSPTISSRP